MLCELLKPAGISKLLKVIVEGDDYSVDLTMNEIINTGFSVSDLIEK